jgi:hypothetical protein
MTISSTQTRISYNGNGVTTEFAFPYLFLAAADLEVRLVAANGAVTLLTLNTDYTVTGVGDDNGGEITLNVAPAVGARLVLNRVMDLVQEIDYITGDPFPAQTHERGLDRLTMMVQQHEERLDRTLQLPITSEADASAIDPEAVEVVAGIADEVTAVALIDDDVSTVAGIDDDVSTVAGISGNVTTVAGISSNVTSVAGNASNINTVATNISNVNAVGSNISNVNAVAGNATNINAVNANKTNIDTVAGISGDVTTVAGIAGDVAAVENIAANVTTVAGIQANVTTVAGISANVTTVANNNANVTAVAGNASNINTVATNIANVNAVGSNISNVNAVAGNATNINAVASNATNVNTVATNIANVNTVGGISGNVTTVAGIAANVTSVAGNASNINQVASDTVAINAASANATAAAASATAAAGSATNAANSAALANAVSLANEPVRHSVRPSLLLDFANTKALDPRITFARASTARFYDGRSVAKAEENLLIRSQEFDDAAWALNATAITRTGNTTTAPDGTTTADSAVGDGTTAFHYFGQSIALASTSTYAFSFYAKANGLNFVQVLLGSAPSFANFDITAGAGAIGTSGGQFGSLAIQDVGNGWYRCSLLMTNPNSSQVYLGLSNNASAARAPSFATSGGIFLWGAQLEQRSSVTAYTPTTTQPITNYVPVLLSAANNVARFDHNPVTGESLGLLIEEQRTNLLLRSEEFDNASWSKTNSSITANTIVAPDGTLTGDKLVENTSTGQHRVLQSGVSTTASTSYTASFYAKAAERNRVMWFDNASASNTVVTFDLSSGSIVSEYSSGVATITSVGNGWYRCSVRSTTGSAQTSFSHSIVLVQSGTTNSYTGDGFSGIYIWGAQLEAGAFPTSYIPTVASQVTRSADAASMTGANFSSWYRADRGTVFSDFICNSTTSYASRAGLSISDGTASNRIIQSVSVASPNSISGIVTAPGSAVTLTTNVTTAIGVNNKQALAFAANNFAASANGGAAVTSTSGGVPVVNTARIGTSESTIGQLSLNGTIKKLAFYPEKLSNAELQALTQI